MTINAKRKQIARELGRRLLSLSSPSDKAVRALIEDARSRYPELPKRRKPLQGDIMESLTKTEPLKAAALGIMLGRKPQTVLKAIAVLIEKGEVVRTEQGYLLAEAEQ